MKRTCLFGLTVWEYPVNGVGLIVFEPAERQLIMAAKEKEVDKGERQRSQGHTPMTSLVYTGLRLLLVPPAPNSTPTRD